MDSCRNYFERVKLELNLIVDFALNTHITRVVNTILNHYMHKLCPSNNRSKSLIRQTWLLLATYFIACGTLVALKSYMFPHL